VYRILTDPSAKGIYYFNRLRQVGEGKTELKPEDQWGKVSCEPLVAESLWNQVNQIIEEHLKSHKRPGRLPVQLFGSVAHCSCGHKMYVRAKSPKYVCRKCHNKIPVVGLEAIFHQELKAFFAEPQRIAKHLQEASKNLSEKQTLLTAHEREIQKVRDEMTRTHRLYLDGQITGQGFGEFYKPAEERLNQLTAGLPALQAEVDFLKVNQLSEDDILHEATTLYDRWPKLPTNDKRKIVESLVEQITVGDKEIDITFSYLPTSEELCKNQQGLRLG
jgi:site-specific DNA recombinase